MSGCEGKGGDGDASAQRSSMSKKMSAHKDGEDSGATTQSPSMAQDQEMALLVDTEVSFSYTEEATDSELSDAEEDACSVGEEEDACSIIEEGGGYASCAEESSALHSMDNQSQSIQTSSIAARTHQTEETNITPPQPAYCSSLAFTRGFVGHQQQILRDQTPKRQITQRRQPQNALETEPTNGDLAAPASATSAAEPVVVLGADISHMSATYQFLVCAAGVFSFNLSFGFLQEFVAVEICNRNLGLFLAMMQFTGYTVLSYVLRTFVNQSREASSKSKPQIHSYPAVPTYMYLALGGLSAIDMAMTNMAMHYINYPAKTLMKSSRVVFTMIFGVLLAGKKYRLFDYLVVLAMVGGLAIFLNADASSNAIFEPTGVVMLIISLICDGATNIMSETIMKNYGVGQDELIFRMYSVALMAVTATATFKGDLHVGFIWMTRPGTYDEWKDGASEDDITWNALGKVTMIVLFSSMGFFGSSCSAAITKNFGALTMSMTSTARRATTLFISFFLFDNTCTVKHVLGVVVFIGAMTTKSLMGRRNIKDPKTKTPLSPPPKPTKDLETGRATQGDSVASVTSNISKHLAMESQQQMSRQTDLRARSFRLTKPVK